MRKLKILVVTLVMTLLMASPSYAAIVINQFGTVNINSNNDTTRTEENNEDNDTTNIAVCEAGGGVAFC